MRCGGVHQNASFSHLTAHIPCCSKRPAAYLLEATQTFVDVRLTVVHADQLPLEGDGQIVQIFFVSD